MKVTGFSFVRNMQNLDYPTEEAIKSILPICDDFVVAVGKSDDNTLDIIKKIDPKIRVIETIWDDSIREGGHTLALETNKAFKEIADDADWAFYIQGDEVVHEKYLDTIKSAMEKYKNNSKVDGLLFKYLHFYGAYNYVGASTHWYRKEIRVIRNNKNIYSYKDAQGFRKDNDKKLNVKPIDAYIYHYGYVRKPKAMQGKINSMSKLYHDDKWMEKNIYSKNDFQYTNNVNALYKFEETHPKVMRKRIANVSWKFEHNPKQNVFTFKDKIKLFTEKYFGFQLENIKTIK